MEQFKVRCTMKVVHTQCAHAQFLHLKILMSYPKKLKKKKKKKKNLTFWELQT